MDRRTAILIIALFSLIVIGMLTFAYLQNSQRDADLTKLDDSYQPVPEPNPILDTAYIKAVYRYEDGTYYITGEQLVGGTCDQLVSDVMVMESYPEQVQLSLLIIEGECPRSLVSKPFEFAVTVSEQATFTGRFQDRSVPVYLQTIQ